MKDPDKGNAAAIVSAYPGNAGDVRTFLDGSTRARLILRTAAVGFGTYQPVWK
jgi:hypothetical protein